MNVQDAFIIYKKIDDEIQAQEVPLQNYINYKLTDPRKIKLFQQVVDSGVDVEKFFLANFILNKKFYIDFYGYNPDKCMTLYHSWGEFLDKKRDEYFRRVLLELKKGYKLNLDDRDGFLELIPITDYLLWSVLYPEDLELLLSLEGDWVKFNMPPYEGSMEFIKRIVRGNMALKRMKDYDLLKKKTLQIITK